MTKEELSTLTLVKLRELAKEKGMSHISALKKSELIEKLADPEIKEEPQKVVKQEPPVIAEAEEVKEEAKPEVKENRMRLVPQQGKPEAVRVFSRPVAEETTASVQKPAEVRIFRRPGAEETSTRPEGRTFRKEPANTPAAEEVQLEENASGILEIMPDGFGFIRGDGFMASDGDIYVSPSQIKRFRLRTGDLVSGNKRRPKEGEKYGALVRVMHVNGEDPEQSRKRTAFEDLTPIFPNERIRLERQGESLSMRVADLISPIGKGQRGLIVSPPKAGKTTILKDMALSILRSQPQAHLIILLIDERPEEVTDIKELITGPQVEVVYSTFDELPERHKRVSEITIEHAKRMVEQGKDVVILLDSITRLARAYNLTEASSGRTLSGGLDPAALYMPKRFFGAARNTREAGSLTILATALVETGSKMDDVIYEEFKGTGNMELILSRKLQERRLFPAIDIPKSGTRREDLLLNAKELDAVNVIRRCIYNYQKDDSLDDLITLFIKTRTNAELVEFVVNTRQI